MAFTVRGEVVSSAKGVSIRQCNTDRSHEAADSRMRSNPRFDPDPQQRRSAPLFRAGQSQRVCQAWHRTSEVRVLAPGDRGAEG